MARPSISTRTGDSGKTGLFGGQRVSKASDRIQSYGDVDELNSLIGLVLSEADLPDSLRTQLCEMQRTLFVLGADLATPIEPGKDSLRVTEQNVTALELWGERLEAELPALTHFVLPRGPRAACVLHHARTVSRRAERWIVALAQKEDINEHARIYINRLSDYLFLASRTVTMHQDEEEVAWIPSS